MLFTEAPLAAVFSKLAQQDGVLRARDLEAHGLGRVYLRRLVGRGQLSYHIIGHAIRFLVRKVEGFLISVKSAKNMGCFSAFSSK